MFYSIFVSFTKWDGVNAAQFTGFDNYVRLFTKDPLFYQSIWNTVVVIVIAIPLQQLFGFFTAVLLKDFFTRSRGAFQFINYCPNITTPVAVGIIFAIMFDSRIGPINQMLLSTGIISNSIDWLGQAFTARLVVIFLLVWKYYGYIMIMFMAGLSSIPEETYEAALIDGAGWWQSLFKITIPQLKPVFTFLITTSVIAGLQLFAEPQLLFARSGQPLGGPERAALTSLMYVYDTAFKRFEFGYGAAMAYGLFMLILLLSIGSIRKITGEEK